MATAAKTTTDHEEIRRWTEAHGGHPAAVKGTGGGTDPGMLRIDFPGFSGEKTLKPISWDSFFRWFDVNELALLYRPSDRFNKLVSRATDEGRKRPRAKPRRAAAKASQPRAAETRKPQRRRKATSGRAASGRAAKTPKSRTRPSQARTTTRARKK